MEITRLSSKGQIVIPQGIREAHHWQAGLKFVVRETEGGLLLTPLAALESTSLNAVIGCVNYKGAKKSLKDMQKGIMKGAKKHK